MNKAFNNIKVLDLSDRVSGAWAARLFGDFGAEVIYQYGIGNPFVIHLQHSGYEDEIARVINDNTEIMIYYPSKLNPASISLKKTINEKAVTLDRISIMK